MNRLPIPPVNRLLQLDSDYRQLPSGRIVVADSSVPSFRRPAVGCRCRLCQEVSRLPDFRLTCDCLA